MDTHQANIDIIFSKYTEPIVALGHALRTFVLSNPPDVQKETDLPANIIGYGYGPGYKNMVCTIIPSKTMMKLGFYKGAELPDPTCLLTGKGKVHKYVEIKSAADIENPAIGILLQQTLKMWQYKQK